MYVEGPIFSRCKGQKLHAPHEEFTFMIIKKGTHAWRQEKGSGLHLFILFTFLFIYLFIFFFLFSFVLKFQI